MKIVVIEDELKTAAYLRKGLLEHGFSVTVCDDGSKGAQEIMTGRYDLVVLDIMLPGQDGWSILAELRQAGLRTPVLVLTARDAVEDRVKGLELGADDYLVKPFVFAELLARIRSIWRRASSISADVIHIADLEIDLVHRRAIRSGVALDLTPKEFSLLALLARRHGEVLPRSLIASEVWNMRSHHESNAVDVHIRRLRSKVDDPFSNKLIGTVRGVGYVLEDRS